MAGNYLNSSDKYSSYWFAKILWFPNVNLPSGYVFLSVVLGIVWDSQGQQYLPRTREVWSIQIWSCLKILPSLFIHTIWCRASHLPWQWICPNWGAAGDASPSPKLWVVGDDTKWADHTRSFALSGNGPPNQAPCKEKISRWKLLTSSLMHVCVDHIFLLCKPWVEILHSVYILVVLRHGT